MKNTEQFLFKYFNNSEKSFYQIMKYHNSNSTSVIKYNKGNNNK